MVQIVYGGDNAFNALVYGQRHPGNQNFIERQMEMFSNTLHDAGSSFMSSMQELYDRFSSSSAIRAAQAAIRKVTSMFDRDEVRSMWDIGQMQAAQFQMQRWIMACPEVRELYHQQRCDGFSDTYIDMHPGVKGADHYDYRRVTDGVIMDTEDGGWVCTNYFDPLEEGDVELTHEAKIDVLSTWSFVRMYLEKGKEDPTSQYGGML